MVLNNLRSYSSGWGVSLLILNLAALAWAAGLSPAVLAADPPAGPPAAMAVVVDIRPGLCPNHLRPTSFLTIPVAVLGTMDFDISNIDPESIRLSRAGMAGQCRPVSWAYGDVGDLVIGSSPDCNQPRGDGFDDLALEFSIPELVEDLGLGSEIGETVPLVLTGAIVTGQGIEGTDQIVVISGPVAGDELSADVGLLAPVDGDTAASEVKLTYYTNTSDHITLAIYDVRGHAVASLVDQDRAPGIYNVTWSGTDRNGRSLPAGTYFARVTNGIAGATGKFTLPQ
jgi:hypothetical protein